MKVEPITEYIVFQKMSIFTVNILLNGNTCTY